MAIVRETEGVVVPTSHLEDRYLLEKRDFLKPHNERLVDFLNTQEA